MILSASLPMEGMGPRLRGDDGCGYGLYGVLIIVSLKLRWARSALAAALPRWTSRFLRQATYSDEPTATLLARQIASSSSPRLETGTSLRDAQAESVSAASVTAMRCSRMRFPGFSFSRDCLAAIAGIVS